MAASGPRFCPRCGTGRVGDMAFCPNCGLDLRQLSQDDAAPGGPVPAGSIPAGSIPAGSTPTPAPVQDLDPDDRPQVPRSTTARAESGRGSLLLPGILVLTVLVAAAWLVGLGPFARPGGDPGPLSGVAVATPTPTASSPFLPPVTSPPSVPPGFTAPPVGLSILSPADGSVVGTKDVTVIGTAPPGSRITQDISFGLDRHATADGTGHWAIQVGLSEGENQLDFRIGDDRSTTQSMRVTYLAPATP